ETAGFTFWNQPPYDSIRDVDVLTGTFSAQYGLGQGVEQYRTKSGTNLLHGDAFFFYRDDKLFAAPGAFLDVNANNRGVVGQPNNGKPILIFVPTAWASNPALIPSGCTVPLTGAGSPGTQWPGNKIPTSCFSQASAGLLKQFPLPAPTNTTAVINNYSPKTVTLNLQTDVSVNVDHNITSKQAIHGLYWRQYFPQPSNEDWVNNTLSNSFINTVLGRAADVTYSNAISSRMVLTGGFLYVYQCND